MKKTYTYIATDRYPKLMDYIEEAWMNKFDVEEDDFTAQDINSFIEAAKKYHFWFKENEPYLITGGMRAKKFSFIDDYMFTYLKEIKEKQGKKIHPGYLASKYFYPKFEKWLIKRRTLRVEEDY